MEPITAAILGTQALGGVMSFKGQRSAARATEQVAEYNARVAENEAVLLARAKRDEQANLRRQHERLAATQSVAIAKSGVELSGSPFLAMADSFFSAERDASRIRYASEIEQVGKASEATLRRIEGQARSYAMNTQAYGTILGDVTSLYSTYREIG